MFTEQVEARGVYILRGKWIFRDGLVECRCLILEAKLFRSSSCENSMDLVFVELQQLVSNHRISEVDQSRYLQVGEKRVFRVVLLLCRCIILEVKLSRSPCVVSTNLVCVYISCLVIVELPK